MSLVGKVLVAQGGGPTAVINQTLAGIVLEARKYPQVTKVYGAVRGVSGIVNEDFLDLSQETSHNLEQVALTTSSALLSTRAKPDSKFCHDIFKVLMAHDIRYFFYIGGNDSSDTVRIVSEEAKIANYDLRAIHVPKTIDNDLMANDHTPGYGSAARFVTQAFMGINLDVRALSGVYIGVVMGRNAGFLTAASAIAQKYPDDGPHLIYLPEREFSIETFLGDVKRIYDKQENALSLFPKESRTRPVLRSSPRSGLTAKPTPTAISPFREQVLWVTRSLARSRTDWGFPGFAATLSVICSGRSSAAFPMSTSTKPGRSVKEPFKSLSGTMSMVR